MKTKNLPEKAAGVLIILLLAAYLFTGLRVFRDYGASADEINQIEAGHITWKAVCKAFGREPSEFEDLPELKSYYNRYYGQAATFPTVIIEALRHFSMDKSSIIRLRHLWNFLLFFTGTCCLAVLTLLRFRRRDVTFFLLLLYILTPRLFGDSFYNDRDVLLISLIWISLLCFEFFRHRPGVLPALLCAFFFALSINTRLLGLILLILPVLFLCLEDSGKKRYAWLMLLMTVLFWYAVTPVYWGNFLTEFASGFRMFASGQQRTQETGGAASVLFFGRYFRETDLPFWYLPVWIFISTPLVPQLLTLTGLGSCLHRRRDRLMDLFMLLFLLPGIAAVMIIRPVLYTGWRHMYFFYVPVFYFSAAGLYRLLTLPQRTFRTAGVCLILASALCTGSRIALLHPYEYIYLNPLFQSRGMDFDRDYWRLSTTECLEWIGEREPGEISIGEYNQSLDNTVIGLPPQLRRRLYIQNYRALHRNPPKYLIFNYSGSADNARILPLYDSVHTVERDGIRIAEVYQRIAPAEVSLREITPPVPEIADGSLETVWRSDHPQTPGDSIVLTFSEPVSLTGLSLLPGEDEREYARDPEILISEDGETWTALPITVSGLFDLSFPETRTEMLMIRIGGETDLPWSIREILFYGSPV